MEASPHRKSRVSVLAKGTGYDGCVPDQVEQRKPSLLHVHSLRSKCQVNTHSSACFCFACTSPGADCFSFASHVSMLNTTHLSGLAAVCCRIPYLVLK